MKKTSRAVSRRRLQRVQKLSAKGAARGARRRTRMAGMPPHTFLAEAMHDFAGDAEKDTLSVTASEVLIVQGDRPPPAEGWSWCCRAGHSGLLPSSYLEVRASKSFAVRMLFDFVGSDPAELWARIAPPTFSMTEQHSETANVINYGATTYYRRNSL